MLKYFRGGLLAALLLPTFMSVAGAQGTIVNPGAEASKRSDEANASTATSKSSRTGRLSTYEMEQVLVEGQRPPEYRDDELIGDYAQPRWTAQRLFSGTRTYVIPKGEVDVEQWFRFKTSKNGDPTQLVAQSEIEFGLPHRLQLDLYAIQSRETGVADSDTTGNSIELRWAFADWGRIWGNPALYLEYVSMGGEPDVVETKLLLGGQVAPGWHWGANLSLEQATSGSRSTERQVTLGLSHTVIDRVLQVGGEARVMYTDERGSRGNYVKEVEIGPSIQYRPLTQMHIDIAPLWGLTKDSHKMNTYVIFGWEF